MSDVRPGVDPERLQNNEENGKFEKSKIYNWTKISIVIIAIFVLLIGILGSMRLGIFRDFVMSDFIAFINAYQGMFITLTGSISIGGIAKNYLKAKTEEKDDGKFIATGSK